MYAKQACETTLFNCISMVKVFAQEQGKHKWTWNQILDFNNNQLKNQTTTNTNVIQYFINQM